MNKYPTNTNLLLSFQARALGSIYGKLKTAVQNAPSEEHAQGEVMTALRQAFSAGRKSVKQFPINQRG